MRYLSLLLLASSFLSRPSLATVLPRDAANGHAVVKQGESTKLPQTHAGSLGRTADSNQAAGPKEPALSDETKSQAHSKEAADTKNIANTKKVTLSKKPAGPNKVIDPERSADSAGAQKGSLPSGFEKALCKTPHKHITPLGAPVIRYPKPAKTSITEYLKGREDVFGRAAAEWQSNLLHPDVLYQIGPKLKERPDVTPLRPGAPTIISLYYPHPHPRADKGQEVYLEKLRLLADLGEQTIIYVSKDVAAKVKKLRSDKHWIVIDEFATIWDIPSNRLKRSNFEEKQKNLFAKMELTGQSLNCKGPAAVCNDAFLSAVFNAKAFITYDAVLRNPFGSNRWAYMDAGLLRGDSDGATQNGKPWDMIVGKKGFLDDKKLDRTIKLTQDTGVVFPEYDVKPGRENPDINHKAFTDVSYQYQNRLYLAGLYVGSSMGMLNYAARYMQTVETLDSNDFYIGREEFVIAFTAVMYPNTIFSQPVQPLPKVLTDIRLGFVFGAWKYMLLSYARPFGLSLLPTVSDPIAVTYCPPSSGYRPRGTLPAGSWEVRTT